MNHNLELESNIKPYYFREKLFIRLTLIWVVVISLGIISAYLFHFPSRIPLGRLNFYTYGLFMVSGIVLGLWYAENLLKEEQQYELYRNLPNLLLVGFVGARLYHVIFNLSYYSKHLFEIFLVWHGGLSIWGILIAIWVYMFLAKLDSKIVGILSLALPLGQAMGRLGNAANYELLGIPMTGKLAMKVPEIFRPMGDSSYVPWFLLEQLTLLLIFVIMRWFVVKYSYSGWQLFSLYIFLYAISRLFLEPLRIPSDMIFGISVTYFTAGILIPFSAIVFWRKHYE